MTAKVGVPPRQSEDDLGAMASIARPKASEGSGVKGTSGDA